MLNLSDFVNIDTKSIWLQVETAEQEKAWQLSQHHSNPIACYNAYLNRVCLHHILNWFQEWLREESSLDAEVFPSEENLYSILEIVNGTAIKIGESRIVLVPTETIDLEELCVPQEWVDIHGWAGDYYIPVQIDLDGDDDNCWMRVCGFATHRQLKNQGRYNQSDRTYSLPIEELTENFTLLFATLGLRLQQELTPEVTLSETEAQNLLQTLSNASIYSPRLRLDVPFAQWAALIVNDQWRQQLYNKRLKLENTVSATDKNSSLSTETANNVSLEPIIRVNLSQWFENLFAAGWQTIDSLNSQFGNLAFEFRSASNLKAGVHGVKLIDLGMQVGGQTLALLLAVSSDTENKISILAQVHPTGNEKYLPANLKVVLTASGKTLQEIQSRNRDCYIQLNRFKGLPGTCFSIKVIVGEFNLTEDFSI